MPRNLFKKIRIYLKDQKLPSHHRLRKFCSTCSGNATSHLLKASEKIKWGAKPTAYDLIRLIRECGNLGCFSYGQQLHCYILQTGFGANIFVSTTLINFYLKSELLIDAHKLFDESPQPTIVAWNSLISGYVHSGQFSKALHLFLQLERSNACSDTFSFTTTLAACGQLSLLRQGKSIHAKIAKLGVEFSVVVANCLIDMYGKCGSVEEAIRVFKEMTDKDNISWNSLIAASARNGRLEQAMGFFNDMPNPDTISYNELINGIAQFGCIENAVGILSRMPNANSSSWNSVITAYVNRSQAREALGFFCRMHWHGIAMDQFTFSSIFRGTASISALTWGIVIHCCAFKCGLDKYVVVGSALIDMYCKCGQLKTAELIFHSLPSKNLVTWNSLISGYAHNGEFTKVIWLFEQLKKEKDIKPDGITLLNVLSACWHNQTPLRIANQYFQSMIKDHGIYPTAEHCASMIRLMSHEGEVWRAEKMIHEFGFGSCGLVWRALLSVCATCGDIEVAQLAAARVIELDGDNEFVYVILSNILAQYGRWGDASEVRELMRNRQVKKDVGCSWIEVENTMPTSLMVW